MPLLRAFDNNGWKSSFVCLKHIGEEGVTLSGYMYGYPLIYWFVLYCEMLLHKRELRVERDEVKEDILFWDKESKSFSFHCLIIFI